MNKNENHFNFVLCNECVDNVKILSTIGYTNMLAVQLQLFENHLWLIQISHICETLLCRTYLQQRASKIKRLGELSDNIGGHWPGTNSLCTYLSMCIHMRRHAIVSHGLHSNCQALSMGNIRNTDHHQCLSVHYREEIYMRR